MDPIFEIELEECPVCRGAGVMQDEQGWSVSVSCMDCGAETAHAEYRTPEQRLEAARRVALLWNMGKVIHTGVGDCKSNNGGPRRSARASFVLYSSILPRAWSASSAVRVIRSSRVTLSSLARRLFWATRMCSKMFRTPRALPKPSPSALSSAM